MLGSDLCEITSTLESMMNFHGLLFLSYLIFGQIWNLMSSEVIM